MRTLPLVPLFLAAGAAAAQAQREESVTSDPCCTITAVNAGTGVVTARERSTGNTFRFEVKDRALLKTLTAGQGVWADFAAKQVSLSPLEPGGNPSINPAFPCCPILPEVVHD